MYKRQALKGGILGLVITIMSILAFAIMVKKFGISDEVISAVNQAVKVASIFMAAYASSKNSTQRQILTGAAAGCKMCIRDSRRICGKSRTGVIVLNGRHAGHGNPQILYMIFPFCTSVKCGGISEIYEKI